jgi:hypothetical protein
LLEQVWLQNLAQDPGETLSRAALEKGQVLGTESSKQLDRHITQIWLPVENTIRV